MLILVIIYGIISNLILGFLISQTGKLFKAIIIRESLGELKKLRTGMAVYKK